jgi:hypothetical protein
LKPTGAADFIQAAPSQFKPSQFKPSQFKAAPVGLKVAASRVALLPVAAHWQAAAKAASLLW